MKSDPLNEYSQYNKTTSTFLTCSQPGENLNNSKALRAGAVREQHPLSQSGVTRSLSFQILPSKARAAVPLMAWSLTASVSPVIFLSLPFPRGAHSLPRVLHGSGLKYSCSPTRRAWLGRGDSDAAPLSVSGAIFSGLLLDTGSPVLGSLEYTDQMSCHHNEQTAHHSISA